MKFSRASSKNIDPVGASYVPEFPLFFGKKNTTMEAAETTTTQTKSNRLFSRNKKEGNDFDMLKTVGGDEDARNEKSTRNIFRRKSKSEKGIKASVTNATNPAVTSASAATTVPAVFAFPTSADKEIREESSSRSLFRSRSKEQSEATAPKEKAKEVTETSPDTATSAKSPPKLFAKGERTQIKAVLHSFSPDAADVIKVEKDEIAPTLAQANHVLIKVQVCLL
jgi:hypothetical protein